MITSVPTPMSGRYRPQCDDNGDFKVQQCWGSTGYCWCVEPSNGTKLSSIEPFRPWEKNVSCNVELQKIQGHHCAATREGLLAAKPLVGQVIPSCNDNGDYESTQCSGSTGYCWCVNELTGERVTEQFRPWEKTVNCVAEAKPCAKALAAVKPGLIGGYVPQCDGSGNFNKVQCHASTGYCWCADPLTGKKVGEQFQSWSVNKPEC